MLRSQSRYCAEYHSTRSSAHGMATQRLHQSCPNSAPGQSTAKACSQLAIRAPAGRRSVAELRCATPSNTHLAAQTLQPRIHTYSSHPGRISQRPAQRPARRPARRRQPIRAARPGPAGRRRRRRRPGRAWVAWRGAPPRCGPVWPAAPASRGLRRLPVRGELNRGRRACARVWEAIPRAVAGVRA